MALSRNTTLAARNRPRNMALIIPRTRTAVTVEINPVGAFPWATREAIWTVFSARETGSVTRAWAVETAAMTVPVRDVNPRLINRPRSRAHLRACRLLTVPIGQPSRLLVRQALQITV